MNRRKIIGIGLAFVAAISIGCAKPEGTSPPKQRINTIEIQVYTPKNAPIQTFTVDLTLRDAETNELLHHPITNAPSQVKVTRSARNWSGKFSYWGGSNVRLAGSVTWPGDDLLGVKVLDNDTIIPQAGHFDQSGRITIIYTTSGI